MSFDQFQRYKTVQILIDRLKRKLGLAQVSILEVGSNGQSNLEAVLPLEKIQYSCLEIPEERKGDHRYIQLDGTDMYQIADGAYDVVVALDVFEHVPSEKREAFLKEMYRTASHMAVLCFPFSNGINERAEKRANSYYKAVYGKDHIWLKEHIENGLPDLKSAESFLKKEEIPYSCFTHGDIRLWEEWMKALFGAYDVPGADGYLQELEEYYAEELYRYDVGKNNYRAFFIMSRQKGLAADLSAAAGYQFQRDDDPVAAEHMLRGLQDLKQLCHRKSCDQVKSFLYMDSGNGWKEEEKLEYTAYADVEGCLHLSCEFQPDPGTQRLRFDPVEGSCCMMSGIRIDSDRGRLTFQAGNGWEHNGCYVFPDPDPQLLILPSEAPVQWIRIEADLVLYHEKQIMAMNIMDRLVSQNIREKDQAVREKERAEEAQKQMADLCQQASDQRDCLAEERDRLAVSLGEAAHVRDELARERDRLMTELGNTARIRDELARERDTARVALGETSAVRDSLAEERDHLAKELGEAARVRDLLAEERDHLAKELGEAAGIRDRLAEEKEELVKERGSLQEERDCLRQQLAEITAKAELYENAYQKMLASASWKVTAPLRKIFGKEQQ